MAIAISIQFSERKQRDLNHESRLLHPPPLSRYYPNFFGGQHQNLLSGLVELIRPFIQITDLSNDSLTQLLSYGDRDLPNDLNRNILQLILPIIHDTDRFD